MIAIRLMGGLGNQMFQYALGRRLALDNDTDLVLDCSWFKEQTAETIRDFELDQLKIHALQTYSVKSRPAPMTKRGRIKNKILRVPTAFSEQSYSFDGSILSAPNNSVLIGFFQSEKYFKDIREVLLKEFQPAYKLSAYDQRVLKQIVDTPISVSLHVRRGDYVSHKEANQFHGLTGLAYYREALSVIESNVGEFFTIFVFSDDPSWCKRNLKFQQKTVFIDGNSHSFDGIWQMSHCNHNILANSSYSWWGGWLNKNQEKIVVAPKSWFQDKSIDTSDVVPGDWVRL